jgi:hypothetical protein
MYLAAATHPDIAFTINKAARVMGRLAEKNWNNVKRIFSLLAINQQLWPQVY